MALLTRGQKKFECFRDCLPSECIERQFCKDCGFGQATPEKVLSYGSLAVSVKSAFARVFCRSLIQVTCYMQIRLLYVITDRLQEEVLYLI